MESLEYISPNLTKESVSALVYYLYGIKVVDITKLNGYYDKNYHVQINSNNQGRKLWPHGYVLKIINSADSQNPSVIEAQIEASVFLGKHGIKCPQPVKNLKSQYYSVENLSHNGTKTSKNLVYMLTYQPGRLIKDIPCTNEILYNIGKLVANVDEILKGFHHPAYESNYISSVSILHISQLTKHICLVQEKDKQDLLSDVINTFEMEVKPVLGSLEKGLLHCDINDQNVLMSETENGSWEFYALLDFGDSHRAAYVLELATNIGHMIFLTPDPVSAPGHIIAGYSTVRSLPEDEFNVLKVCVCARICQLILLGMSTYQKDPGNEYLLGWLKRGALDVLNLLWNIPTDELNAKWRAIIASYDI